MWLHKLLLAVGCVLHAHSASAIWSCTRNEECHFMVGSICESGECSCPPGLQAVSGGTACAETPLYYMSLCFDDSQCSRLVANYQCRKSADSDSGACTCQPNHHYEQGRCWPSSDWSEKCTTDVQCMGALRDPWNMMCKDSVCVCADGYYLRQRGECRKIATAIGENCVLDEDCQFEGGSCDARTNKCVGPEGRTINATKLNMEIQRSTEVSPPNSSHGATCSLSTDCNSPFECTNLGVCACPRGYYPDRSNQICLALLGSPVIQGSGECVGIFKEIRDGRCACQANYYFSADYRSCIKPAIRLTDFCFDDISCHSFGVAARCGPPRDFGLRSCECDPELSTWNENRRMCMLTSGVGDACEVNADCFSDPVELKCVQNLQGQGVCSCPTDFTAVNGICFKFGLKLGEECRATVECSYADNAVCSNGVCTCSNGYQQLNDFCAPEIGGACTQNSNCVVDNTVCTSGTCQCAPDYVEADVSCWKKAEEFGSPCNITKQCSSLGEGFACLNEECVCDTTYHYREGRCWPKMDLFQPCRNSNECFLRDLSERVHCRNGLCQCTFDYPYSEELRTCTSSSVRTTSSHIYIVAAILYYILQML